jgi:hypothetical protein
VHWQARQLTGRDGTRARSGCTCRKGFLRRIVSHHHYYRGESVDANAYYTEQRHRQSEKHSASTHPQRKVNAVNRKFRKMIVGTPI